MIRFLLLGLLLSLLLSACGGGSDESVNDDSLGTGGTGVVDEYNYLRAADEKEVIKFLTQASFGPTEEEVASVMEKGFATWIDDQMQIPHTEDGVVQIMTFAKEFDPNAYPLTIEEYMNDDENIFNSASAALPSNKYFSMFQMSMWFRNALLGEEQLRHRMAHALSQIIVISNATSIFDRRADGLSAYYEILTKHAFGNYKDILKEISHHPSMGIYLTFLGNKKAQGVSTPDENYAREIMQLFTIGLIELNLDGTAKLDANGQQIPTYTQADIEELSRVFTGWDMAQSTKYGKLNGDLHQPMKFNSEYHDDDEKTVLGKILSAGNGEQDINKAIDILYEHPNVAPFISTLLIKRLTSSNPSPAYVTRVATLFNDNGSGVKGDLKTVLKAILLDEEVRGTDTEDDLVKYKEPLVAYTQFLRAFDVQGFNDYPSRFNTTVSGLWMSSQKNHLGQEPTGAETVFNFYSPDYIPADNEFIQNNITAPEIEIQTSQILINFSNKIYDILSNHRQSILTREKNYIIHEYGHNYGSLEQYVETSASSLRSVIYGDKFYVNLDKELDIFEMALDGDTNRDFQNINATTTNSEGDTPKQVALKALIEHLDMKLTAQSLTLQQKQLLVSYLDEHVNEQSSNQLKKQFREAHRCVAEAIRAIVTSSTYMVQ